jgi:hypothetical protein
MRPMLAQVTDQLMTESIVPCAIFLFSKCDLYGKAGAAMKARLHLCCE